MKTLHDVTLLCEPYDSTKGKRDMVTGFTRSDTGFTMQFANGYGLSVQWSPSHLCSQYGARPSPGFNAYADPHSNAAECCEITPSGLGKVHAHCDAATVTKLLARMERRMTES